MDDVDSHMPKVGISIGEAAGAHGGHVGSVWALLMYAALFAAIV
jgi:hypothetical protein